MDLSVNIGKVFLKNPVLTASGTFGSGLEYKNFIDLENIGAIVTKTVTFEPRKGNPPPRIWEVSSGVLNSVGLHNEGIEHFYSHDFTELKKLDLTVVVSVGGRDYDEYLKSIERINMEDRVDAVEVNISCPNVKNEGLIFGKEPHGAEELIKTLRKATEKPLWVKLSPYVSDISDIALAVENAGADAVSLINTFPALAVDIESLKPRLGGLFGGLSGPAIKPIALKMVWEVYQKVKIPVIGMGGITNYKDALEFIIAGATAVAIGTSNFANPYTISEVIKGLEEYM
ncbi:MAG: dihydroorotate dehydrogenase, partial [Actinomycetia bacterium]|nr:dihydroorotate dehydrogenase [Actinomycetes bacterium]